MHPRLALFLTLLACSAAALLAVPPRPNESRKKPPADEPHQAMKRIRVPQGMQIDLWAAEPMLANPVVFAIDRHNRFYVAETYRLHAGVTDIRGHMDWLSDDLACRSVEDRLAMMRRHLGKKFADAAVHQERVRLLEDTTGKGKADRTTVFADGFNRPQDGIAAGLLARGPDVYYACLPDLWRLHDSKGAGKADHRTVLHTGFGVHVGYIGHDLHGLVMGPEGKLYFSIGDRGLNVRTRDRHLFYPDTGCVLRCNPDGSDLEVFATGLRNPQELAFDQYGNLFTGDNNSDGGDRARWVYVVEGGDSGWRIGYQFGGSQSNRGPWNAEKLWHPQHAGQPAWVVPPVANLADGPSGLTYYPGTGLPPRYDEHFFLADFRGAPGPSGVRSFAVKPKGAGFELTDSHEFVWGVLATDVDFGTDGAVYISDWVQGWGLTGKGRIWKVSDPKLAATPAVREVKKLLAEGVATGPVKDLLGHRDMRVRLEAQWALAGRDKDGIVPLSEVLKSSKNRLARLHAIWGLGQVGRRHAAAYEAVLANLADADAEVRAQAAKVLGEGKVVAAEGGLVKRLADEEPRVQFFAAQALSKLGKKEAFAPVVELLRGNADRDVYLRQAGVLALAACGDEKRLQEAARDTSPSVRRAVLLAYRRLGSAEAARFLDDADPELVAEAARAINDVPIEAGLGKLAGLISRRGLSEPLGYRVLNANFRLGTPQHARAVAAAAARGDLSVKLRLEALAMLRDWEKPAGRDRVMGLWRPLPPRAAGIAAEALRPALAGVFTGPDELRQSAVKVAAALGVKEVGPTLLGMLSDVKRPTAERVETLRALQALKDERLDKSVGLALADAEPRLRAEGRRVLARSRPQDAVAALEQALQKGTSVEKQLAFETLGEMKSEPSERLLEKWLDALIEGKVPAEARLDLVEAAEKRGTEGLKKKLAAYEQKRPKDEPLGRWRDSLVGGDAEAGRKVFLDKSEVSCLRCHKAAGEGVGEVGPDLTGVGSRQKRDYLLESIVYPNKHIAKGYETVDLVLATGQVRSGIVRGEDAREVRLMTAEGTLVVVRKDQIEERKTGKSAMPDDLVKHLSRKDVRDLVEFLAGLKEAKK